MSRNWKNLTQRSERYARGKYPIKKPEFPSVTVHHKFLQRIVAQAFRDGARFMVREFRDMHDGAGLSADTFDERAVELFNNTERMK